MDDRNSAPYGARERAALAALDAQLRAADPGRASGTELADLLREQLPDIDDTTLGRVLIALTGESSVIAILVARQQHPAAQEAIARLWAALARAGLELTAPVWQPRQYPGPEPGQDR